MDLEAIQFSIEVVAKKNIQLYNNSGPKIIAIKANLRVWTKWGITSIASVFLLACVVHYIVPTFQLYLRLAKISYITTYSEWFICAITISDTVHA